MTYPLIGNYGRLAATTTSPRGRGCAGLVVAHATAAVLDDARQLATLLRSNGIPAIAGVDTRALARHLRATGSPARDHHRARHDRPRRGRRRARAPSQRWEDQDFVAQVSPGRGPRGRRRPVGAARRDRRLRPQDEHRPLASAGAACGSASCPTPPPRPTSSRRDVAGVVFSPGPRRPGAARRVPSRWPGRSSTTAGRCSGSASGTRSSARAAGAETRRLRFGHHGANHPVQDLDTGYVQVTAQNHEVQVVGDSLPASSGFRVSQLNLNDRSVEGLRHAEKPIETVQYHPEGAPGPLDALAVFDRFVEACRRARVTTRVETRPLPGRPSGRIARSPRRS